MNGLLFTRASGEMVDSHWLLSGPAVTALCMIWMCLWLFCYRICYRIGLGADGTACVLRSKSSAAGVHPDPPALAVGRCDVDDAEPGDGQGAGSPERFDDGQSFNFAVECGARVEVMQPFVVDGLDSDTGCKLQVGQNGIVKRLGPGGVPYIEWCHVAQSWLNVKDCSRIVVVQDSDLQPSLYARRRYLSKLHRMQVYAVVSSVAGVFFFLQSFWAVSPVEHMLVEFDIERQVFFTMAIAHWSVNIAEDWLTGEFLSQGLEHDFTGGLALFPLNLCFTAGQIVQMVYFAHHITAIFAYSFSLATHKLSGLCVQGLLFELPVNLMLRREVAVASDTAPPWLLDQKAVKRHWLLTYVGFLVGRCPATALWLVAFSGDYPQSLDLHLRSTGYTFVFHMLAVFFTSLNMRIVGLYLVWHQQDMDLASSFARSATPAPAETSAG